MGYEPPEYSVLAAAVSRTLRDDDGVVFGPLVVTDFINGGLAELNEVRPLELQVDIAGDDITQVIDVDALGLKEVFAVESAITLDGRTLSRYVPSVDVAVPGHRAGWDLFAGKLDLGGLWFHSFESRVDQYGAPNVALRVSGYGDRDVVDGTPDAIVPTESLAEEHFIRRWAAVSGFRSLETDRGLFQQWIAQSNNADVSQTQLTNLRSSAESDFNRLSRSMLRLRRPVMG